MTEETPPWVEGDQPQAPAAEPATPAKKVISSIAELIAVSAYLQRIGARARSFRTAVVETKGEKYKREIATIRFHRGGVIEAPEDYLPTPAEQEAITVALAGVEFPKCTPLTALHSLPPELENVAKEHIYTFYNDTGQIVMLQQRVEAKTGKAYHPWTYWSDGMWRKAEPEGLLPLWGSEQLDDNAVVFIHEGAKAARAVVEELKVPNGNSPWLNEMRNAAHVGWIGGAPNPHRTDWDIIRRKGIKRVYIVSDNDAEGRNAIPKISRALVCPTFHLQFDQQWPEGFDLADPFPEAMYREVEGERIYVGPSFSACIHPATWATDETIIPPEGRGPPRRVHSIRPQFAAQWTWVEGVDLFIANEFPDTQLKKDVFNASVSAFSHARDTGTLLQKHYSGRSVSITYRPDVSKRFITDRGRASINLYRPALVKPRPGSIEPFENFLAYMFPAERERHNVKRWVATLLAKPATRIMYGMMVLSEMQGIGKTTLAQIISEGVGHHNVSFPGEALIVQGQFNGWLANKRLIIVNEIYSGHSWQAYNRLKTCITDDMIEVNIKHQATYTIPNWTHYYVCSNSMNALKVEDKDRRWFVPKVTEVPWPPEKFAAFRAWLDSGGVAKILHWASTFNDYVKPGEIAPMTIAKQRLIEDSRSEAEACAAMLAEFVMSMDKTVAIPLVWVKDWVKDKLGAQHVYENERRLGNVMRACGMEVTEERIVISGKKIRLATNKPDLVRDLGKLREYLTHPKDIISQEF